MEKIKLTINGYNLFANNVLVGSARRSDDVITLEDTLDFDTYYPIFDCANGLSYMLNRVFQTVNVREMDGLYKVELFYEDSYACLRLSRNGKIQCYTFQKDRNEQINLVLKTD